MKKLIICLILVVLCLSGCVTGSVVGFGSVKTDPGLRVYKKADIVYINITHKQGEEQPNYSEIAEILDGVFQQTADGGQSAGFQRQP